jgi:hypothetical protein
VGAVDADAVTGRTNSHHQVSRLVGRIIYAPFRSTNIYRIRQLHPCLYLRHVVVSNNASTELFHSIAFEQVGHCDLPSMRTTLNLVTRCVRRSHWRTRISQNTFQCIHDSQHALTEAQLSSKINNMSSLSRRACYKCGNVGHYAEVCSSSERLCYNCKQPGIHLRIQNLVYHADILDRPRVEQLPSSSHH